MKLFANICVFGAIAAFESEFATGILTQPSVKPCDQCAACAPCMKCYPCLDNPDGPGKINLRDSKNS